MNCKNLTDGRTDMLNTIHSPPPQVVLTRGSTYTGGADKEDVREGEKGEGWERGRVGKGGRRVKMGERRNREGKETR